MTDPSNDPQAKKIIIDEDWKSQVQAEREGLKEKEEESQPGPQADPAGPIPPPSLVSLVSSLGIQAMVAMGAMADPSTGKPRVKLDQSKHLIDMIQMLEDKTQGNRTQEETDVMEHLLHELRMAYVAARTRPAPAKEG